MKITAPISKLSEIEPLMAAGADEFYCGAVPQDWVARFNTGAVNRRYFGNLDSLEKLREAVRLAHRGSAPLFLALNAQHYGQEQADAIVRLTRAFRDFDGDAVIVADVALIAEIRTNVPDIAIHVSSVAGCRNSEAVRFYGDLGVRRVILPRDVTLDEVAGIVRNAGDIEIEAFVLNDGCVFEEGTCHGLHLPAKLGGPLCLDNRPFTHRTARGRRVPEQILQRLRKNDADYKRWLWYRSGCGFSTTPDGYPYGPCGLCAISHLAEIGVASVKIAGREASAERKSKSVEMVRATLDRVVQGEPAQAVARFATALRKDEDRCRSGFMCYYPEVRSRD